MSQQKIDEAKRELEKELTAAQAAEKEATTAFGAKKAAWLDQLTKQDEAIVEANRALAQFKFVAEKFGDLFAANAGSKIAERGQALQKALDDSAQKRVDLEKQANEELNPLYITMLQKQGATKDLQRRVEEFVELAKLAAVS